MQPVVVYVNISYCDFSPPGTFWRFRRGGLWGYPLTSAILTHCARACRGCHRPAWDRLYVRATARPAVAKLGSSSAPDSAVLADLPEVATLGLQQRRRRPVVDHQNVNPREPGQQTGR